jgi:hypothetical protein
MRERGGVTQTSAEDFAEIHQCGGLANRRARRLLSSREEVADPGTPVALCPDTLQQKDQSPFVSVVGAAIGSAWSMSRYS